MSLEDIKELGFSQYEIVCYMTLLSKYPANGSRLSQISGLARSRIYDALRSLVRKGFIDEIGKGSYVPLPPDELYKRLRNDFESNLNSLKEEIKRIEAKPEVDHVWTITGYRKVMDKAREMVESARRELYVRLFATEGKELEACLRAALKRGVEIKYVALGKPYSEFPIQVLHRDVEPLVVANNGRPFDLAIDRSEVLSGIFLQDEENSPVNWSRNWAFVATCREKIRHEFFSAYLHKTMDLGESLTESEKEGFTA